MPILAQVTGDLDATLPRQHEVNEEECRSEG
jgi:hypothetical protein